jgi:hypothetical protein
MRIINSISQALQAVIGLTGTPQYVVNQAVRIICPPGFGMPQIDKQTATVLAVDSIGNTITVNIDSRNFSPFIYPAGGQAAKQGATAQVIPIGDANGTLAFPFDNLGPNPTTFP